MRNRVGSWLNVCCGSVILCAILALAAFGSAAQPAVARSVVPGDHDAYYPLTGAVAPGSVSLSAGPLDLQIAKSAYPPTAFPGQTVTYTLVFSNVGPSVASSIRVTDTFPAEIIGFELASSAPITLASSLPPTWAWDVAGLNPGEHHVITLTCLIDPAMAGDRAIENVALVTDTQQDTIESTPLDNLASASVYVPLAPELRIGKRAVPSTGLAYHGEITYTVAVTNALTAGDAVMAVMQDALPGQVDFARWVLQPAGSVESDDRIVWSGNLSAGSAITWTFVVSHAGYYGGTFTNTASIAHVGRETRQATAAVVLQDSPNPTINKSVTSPPTVTIGSLITYELVIDLPPDAGQQLYITDTLADGLDYAVESTTQLASNHPTNIGRLNQPAGIATDRAGNSHIVWIGHDGSDNEIWLQRITSGGQHGLPLQLTSNGNQDRDPDLAVDAGGATHIVWEGIATSGFDVEILYLCVGADGTIGSVLNVSDNSGVLDDRAQVAVDATGNAYIVWTYQDGTEKDIFWRKVNADRTLGPVLNLTLASPGVAKNPSLAVDVMGNSYVAWQANDGNDDEIRFVRVSADGIPGPVVQLTHNTSTDQSVQVVADPLGIAQVVWRGRFGGAGNDDEICWVRIDQSGAPGVIKNITDNIYTDYEPRIVLDAWSNAYIAWRGTPAGGLDPEIMWVRVASDGTPGVAVNVTDNTSIYDADPRIAVGSAGVSSVLWTGRDPGVEIDSEVYYVTISPSGVMGTIRDLTHNSSTDDAPEVVLDLAGNAYAIWQEAYSTNHKAVKWHNLSGATLAGQEVGWNLGTVINMAPGAPITITFNAIVSDTAGNFDARWLTNTAGILYQRSDGPTWIQANTVDVQVLVPALVVTKTASGSVVEPGDVITFTILVTNVGAGPAAEIVVEDVLPSVGFSYRPGTTRCTWPRGTGLVTSDPSGLGTPASPYRWDLGATLGGGTPVGESLSLEFQVAVSTAITNTGQYTNWAYAYGVDIVGTPIPADNTDHVPDDTDLDDADAAMVQGREGRIAGQVWWDADGDGLRDETPIIGYSAAKVILRDIRGVSIDTTSDSGGEFLFPDLRTETYTVTLDVSGLPAWAAPTSPVLLETTLTPAALDDLSLYFGLQGPGLLGDTIWRDYDRDGVQDDIEPGMEDVDLDLSVAGVLWAVTRTDSAGTYDFAHLPLDVTYDVRVTAPAGYYTTGPLSQSSTLSTGSPADLSLDLGLAQDILDVRHRIDYVCPGWGQRYDIEVQNVSGRALTGVVVRDPLPNSLRFASTTGLDGKDTGGTYDPTTHAVTWDLGTLVSGQVVALHLHVYVVSSAHSGDRIINGATLSSNQLREIKMDESFLVYCPTPTPSPIRTSTLPATATATATASRTPKETASPTETRTPKGSVTPTLSETELWSATPTETLTETPTATRTPKWPHGAMLPLILRVGP